MFFMAEKVRKEWIDGLRGLAMIVVVYGHCLLSDSYKTWSAYFVFFSPFNVALFFTISGYLFKHKEGKSAPFFKYIINRLFIPWMILGLFPYYDIMTRFPRVISGAYFWFLSAFIVAEIVWFYIHKYSNSSKQVIAYGLIVSALGMVLFQVGWLNYGMVNRGLTLQYLFVLGYVIRQYESQLFSKIRSLFIPLSLLFICLGFVFMYLYPQEFYDLKWNRYYFLPLTLSIIVLGIVLIFYAFSCLKKVPKWLVYVGQNTILIYILHNYGRRLFKVIFYDTNILPDIPFLFIAIFEAIFACGFCCLLSYIANKYAPVIVGKKR